MTEPTAPSPGSDPPRLRVLSLAELLDADLPPREPLLDGLMKVGDSLMLWAETGLGKTMAALSIAIAVGGGGSFLQWPALTPRRVLHIDGEMNLTDLRERVDGLLRGSEGCDVAAARANIFLLARQGQDPDSPFPDLAQPEGQAEIRRMAEECGASLVILDNFSVLADVADENAAAAMNPVLSFLMTMKTADIATILIHHAKKGGKSFRGSSKLAATFEVIVGLRATTTVRAKHGTAFDLAIEKFRDKRNGSHAPTTAWLEEGPDGTLRWDFERSEDDRLTALCAAVLSMDFPLQTDLAKHLGVDPAQITRMKAKAIHKGIIAEADWTRAMTAAKEATAPIVGAAGLPDDEDDDTANPF